MMVFGICSKKAPYLYATTRGYKTFASFREAKDYFVNALGMDWASAVNKAALERLNGKSVFECECRKALEANFDYGRVMGTYSPMSSLGNFKGKGGFTGRTGLSEEQLKGYITKGKDFFLYLFEGIRSVSPFDSFQQLFKDDACTIPLTRAPQSYCFAYRLVKVSRKKEGFFHYVDSEKVLVFSIRSPWCCKYLNGEKDIEVRNRKVAKAGIEYL